MCKEQSEGAGWVVLQRKDGRRHEQRWGQGTANRHETRAESCRTAVAPKERLSRARPRGRWHQWKNAKRRQQNHGSRRRARTQGKRGFLLRALEASWQAGWPSRGTVRRGQGGRVSCHIGGLRIGAIPPQLLWCRTKCLICGLTHTCDSLLGIGVDFACKTAAMCLAGVNCYIIRCSSPRPVVRQLGAHKLQTRGAESVDGRGNYIPKRPLRGLFHEHM